MIFYIYLQCSGQLVENCLILVFHSLGGKGSFPVFFTSWDHCVKQGSGLEIMGAVSCSRKAEENCLICSN